MRRVLLIPATMLLAASHVAAAAERARAESGLEPTASLQPRNGGVLQLNVDIENQPSREALAVCDAAANLTASQLDEWSALYEKATKLVTAKAGIDKASCEADLLAYNASACVPNASGLEIAPTGLGLKWDAYYCGSSAVNWTNLTGQSDKPMNDVCNAPLDEDAYTYRADGSVLTCAGRTNQQVVAAWCHSWVAADPTEPVDVKALANNVPTMACLYGGANCDKLYCQTCSDMCPHSRLRMGSARRSLTKIGHEHTGLAGIEE